MMGTEGRVGFIVGSSALGPGGERLTELAADLGVPFVQRHGSGPYRPPHRIEHVANLTTLHEAGCDRVVAVSSVGSVGREHRVGTLICPDDYIALGGGESIFEDGRGHGARDLAGPWRDELVAAWGASGAAPMADGGIYWQSRGPRFETPAEVRLIAPHADVVGMTMASECVAAHELGLLYAAVCVVDNLANGLASEPLTLAQYERGRAAGVEIVHSSLEAVLPLLPGGTEDQA